MTGRRYLPLRVRWLPLLLCVALAACGSGGGGGSGDSSASVSTPETGGSSSSDPANAGNDPTTPTVPQSTTANVVNVSVAAMTTPTPNMLTTSVTICEPGTTTCTTIDNVQVDTGSAGLRLLASALPSGFALPAVTAGSGTNPAGECLVFGSGYTWGAVRSADVKLAGEVASSLPVQIIADPSVPATPPTSCASASAMNMDSTDSLRVNGILGVGLLNADCGTGCVNQALPSWYYACASGSCSESTQLLSHQVSNPVAAFATDNNGVVIALPAITGSNGAASVAGTMTFGIGTQANNAPGSATVLHANDNGDVETTTSDGTVYSTSYLDTGSNALFFWSSTLAECDGIWFCPNSPQSLSATIKGTDGVTASTSFTVADAQTLFDTGDWAFNTLAAYNGNAFGWGLPFFFGKNVFMAIEGQTTSVGTGPFYAF